MSTSDNAYARRLEGLVHHAEQSPKILLKGIIPNPWTPSDALLNVELALTGIFSQEDYMAWKEGLEDLLNDLDKKYAKRESGLRGRRVDAHYKTMMQERKKVRVRMLAVQPYPSRFASWLGYIRTQFYGSPNITGVLEKYSIILSEQARGKLIIQTRLVPEAMIPKLHEGIRGLNDRIDELQEEIDKYEKTPDFQAVKDYILREVPGSLWSKHPDKLHAKLHHIELNPWPIVASKDFIESFTEEETRNQIRDSVANIVEQAVEASQKQLSQLTATMTKLLAKEVTEIDKKDLEELGGSLQHIKEMSIESNTYQFIRPKMETIEALVEAVQTGNPEEVQGAAIKAAKYFGLVPDKGAKPISLLRAIGSQLTEGVDPRIHSLIEKTLGD